MSSADDSSHSSSSSPSVDVNDLDVSFGPEIDHIMAVLEIPKLSQKLLKARGLSLATAGFVETQDMVTSRVPSIAGRALLDALQRLSKRSHPAKDASMLPEKLDPATYRLARRYCATTTRWNPTVVEVAEPLDVGDPAVPVYDTNSSGDSSDEETTGPRKKSFGGKVYIARFGVDEDAEAALDAVIAQARSDPTSPLNVHFFNEDAVIGRLDDEVVEAKPEDYATMESVLRRERAVRENQILSSTGDEVIRAALDGPMVEIRPSSSSHDQMLREFAAM